MIFCFKQKTAYEMRISDWSSDVCSSDLGTLNTGDLSATAAGIGGNGGTYSNSSGAATGIRVGGEGGVGTGGTATIAFAPGITSTGTISTSATVAGGPGADGMVGGGRGAGRRGAATLLTSVLDSGPTHPHTNRHPP